MAKQFAVIGLGRFGQKLAVSLEERGGEVLAIDSDARRVEEIKDKVSAAIRMNGTDESALRAQGVDKVDVAVVCIGESFEANLLTTVIVKRMGVPLVITRTSAEVHSQILSLVGADKVIFPEEDVAVKLAQNLTIETILDYVPISDEHTAAQVSAPKKFWGKTLGELDMRRKFGVNLVAIKRMEGSERPGFVDDMPGAETAIAQGDILIVVGRGEDIETMASS
ncbi:MAG TPA: TrkA family potassium uptake protein [bacterium]|nr:TrkA family potassium uptake protein [bacterium]